MLKRFEKAIAHILWTHGTWRGASRKTVAITGSPRSGTTWLLEMIEKATRARRIWEPFPAPSDALEEDVHLGLRPYVPPTRGLEGLYAYLAEMFKGSVESPGTASGVRAHGRCGLAVRMMTAPATVVKFCRLQRLLPWLGRRFDLPVVLLVRHPLAVVASQIRHAAWSDGARDHPVLCSRVRKDFPELSAFADELSHLDERLAATWAFDYLVPLSHWKSLNGVKLVTYADLIRSVEVVLGETVEFLDLQDRPRGELPSLDEPSATTHGDSNVRTGGDPLATWKNRLDQEQVDRIVGVVDRFGLNPYDESMQPRWDRLVGEYEVVEQ